MATYQATQRNDRWTVPRYGDPSNTLIDGLGGQDVLSFDRLPQSRFIITEDAVNGYIKIDSVSGASSTYHLRLKNVEALSFNNGRDVVDLVARFADSTPPLVTSFSPASTSAGAAIDSNIVINFDEAITLGGGTLSLRDASGTLIETFSMQRMSAVGSVLTIDPSQNLSFSQTYTLELGSAAVKDSHGNSFAGGASYQILTRANTAPLTYSASYTVDEDGVLSAILPAAVDAEAQVVDYVIDSNPVHGSLQLDSMGNFQYSPQQDFSGVDSFTYQASDGDMSSIATTVDILVQPIMDRVYGTLQSDVLTGNPDTDLFEGGAGDDVIDGGPGIDYAQYGGALSDYQITRTNGELHIVDKRGIDGSDILLGVERLVFSDQGLAFDLDGDAGFIAELLGLILGPDAVANTEFVGAGLDIMESGISREDLMSAAFDVRLGANAPHSDIVDLIFTNLTGGSADVDTHSYVTSLLDNGTYSAGQLGVLAAELPLNQESIGYASLTDSGVGFIIAGALALLLR